MALRIVATKPNPALVTLPWHLSLDEWGDDVVVLGPIGRVESPEAATLR